MDWHLQYNQLSSRDYNYTLHITFKNIHSVFYTRLLKRFKPNNTNKFLSRANQQPEVVEDNRYEVEKALEFRTMQGTQKKQYKIKQTRQRNKYDLLVYVEDIDEEILKDFQKNRNKERIFRLRIEKSTSSRKKTLDMLEKQKRRVLGLDNPKTNLKDSRGQFKDRKLHDNRTSTHTQKKKTIVLLLGK